MKIFGEARKNTSPMTDPKVSEEKMLSWLSWWKELIVGEWGLDFWSQEEEKTYQAIIQAIEEKNQIL